MSIGIENKEDDQLDGKARRFVLGSTLMRDACVSRLEINFKRDLKSVKLYEQFYAKPGVALYYLFTIINLFTIIFEHPASVLINGNPIPYYVPLMINLICEAYFYYRWFLIQLTSQKAALKENLSSKLSIIILVTMTLDAIIYIICQQVSSPIAVRFSRGLRPILLLTFPENLRLRTAVKNVWKTAIDVIPVIALFFCTVIFFSIVGVTLLGDLNLFYPDGKPYFHDFFDILWEMYVLTTTANSPDIIIPAYEYNRIFVLLYIIVCTACNWLFMGILTASVYNSYKAHLGEFVVNRVNKRKRKLDEAFFHISTIQPTNETGVTQKVFLRLMHIVKPRRSEDSLRVLFHILNKSRTGYLNIHEFGRLSEYMQVRLIEVELSRDYFKTFLPKFYNVYTSPPFQAFKRVVEHKITHAFFTTLVVANGVTAILLNGFPSIQDTIEWFFTIAFLVELILNYLACGGVRFFGNPWNLFDCVIVFAALFGQVLQLILLSIGIEIPQGVTQSVLLLRCLRLFRVFSVIPSFKIVIGCILTILPSLAAYMTLLLILFYLYACIGMEAFSFLYTHPANNFYNASTHCGNEMLLGTDFVRFHYCLFSFNSATEAFIMLTILTVGNNWQVFAEGHVLSTNRATRLYFLFIHWTCVLLVLNIVLAFIIEAFLMEFDTNGNKFEEYVYERLEEMGMNATTELKKRGIHNFNKNGYQITKTKLDATFPQNGSRSKAFILGRDSASIEILMFRMFEKEVEDIITARRISMRQPRFQTHDALGSITH